MMNINPLFLNSLGGQAIETDLKNKKFDSPAYLFSDIIKIYTDDNTTDITASANISKDTNPGLGESDEVVDLNNLFEQVNKKIENPFAKSENGDVNDVENSNVTVFKYVFEELGNNESVDSANDLKLSEDGSTHISDVDINALVNNIINLIQNSGIASSFDNNFNVDSISTFLADGGNVELNIETSDGVIKLSFEQNGAGSGNATNNVKFPGITPSADEETPVVPQVQTEEGNANPKIKEDISKQMSLKISVFKDSAKPEQNISLNNTSEQKGAVNDNVVNNSDPEIPIVNQPKINSATNQEATEHIQIENAPQHPDIILNDNSTSAQSLKENTLSPNTNAQENTANQINNIQKSDDANNSGNKPEIKVESANITNNKGAEKSGNTQSFVNVLAEDKNITEISYKEEKINTAPINDSSQIPVTQETVSEFNDLPLFSSKDGVVDIKNDINKTTDTSIAEQPVTNSANVNNSGQFISEDLYTEKQNTPDIKTVDSQKDLQSTGAGETTSKGSISTDNQKIDLQELTKNGNPDNTIEVPVVEKQNIVDIKIKTVDPQKDLQESTQTGKPENIVGNNNSDSSKPGFVNNDSTPLNTEIKKEIQTEINAQNNTTVEPVISEPENLPEVPFKNMNNSTTVGHNINVTVKNFINNVIKGKETVENSNSEEKPVIQTNNNSSDATLDNIDQSKSITNSDVKNDVQPVEITGKTNIENSADIQPEIQTETKNTGQNQETINSGANNITQDNRFTGTDVKATKQFDIKLNGTRSISSVDLLSKVHKFISDNVFAEKQASTDSEQVGNNVNNAGTDSSTSYLNSLNEFTQSADISLLNNKSNFVLQKQNYKENNKDGLKNNNESIADVNSQVKADVKTETVHISTEDEKAKKKDFAGITSQETIKTSAEDKIITDAEEKIKQNLPVNEKKVFTPDLSLVNPFGSRDNSKVEVSKNSGSTLKVSDVSESSTKNVEKSNSENSTGKESKDNGNNTSFNLNHTVPERVTDKANTIHEEMKFTLPDEKLVKYSKLMPEIKNALSEGVNKSLTISLTPEELGKVKLIVETVDKTVSAKIEVQNETVQNTVQNNLDNLKQSLSQSGLNINNITVSISYNDNRQQKPGELKKKHTSGNDKKIETEEEKISSNKNTSKTLGYNTYEYLA